MKNTFYNEFDCQQLHESKRENDFRSHFQIDRDRIIHSSEFRRLQGKTQVFLPGEYDFYRTRLTHSIEVSQIGRSICNWLNKMENSLLSEDYHIDADLVEATCLAHDLGHPPFGHMGERSLNKLLTKYGGFEGNAQTLRLITEVFYRTETGKRGMNPTRAFLDGILKYKALFKQFKEPENHFIYDYQKQYLDFVYEGIDLGKELPDTDDLNDFRSIECQIMDWADDTAYAINDLVDSIYGGFMNIAKLVSWGNDHASEYSEARQKDLEDIIEWTKAGKFKPKFGSQIGQFVTAVKLGETENIMSAKTNRHKYKLVIDEEYLDKARFYKQLSIDMVFRSSHLHQVEFKGDYMVRRIVDVLLDNYINSKGNVKLLHEFNHSLINAEQDVVKKVRMICDHIAGMTDAYAMRYYKRLFDPGYSSISDIV